MTFWAVGRDGHGGLGSDEAQVTVAAGAGPFKVTYPNTAVVIKGGKKKKVKWDVAKTNLAPVSATNVKILLSTDNGLTFRTVLKASTPNDGEEKVKFPKIGTLKGRVKIQGVDNIFFDMSDKNFAIDGGFSFVGVWHMRAEFGSHLITHVTIRDNGTLRHCFDSTGTEPCIEGNYTVEDGANFDGHIEWFGGHSYDYEIVGSGHVNLYFSGNLEYTLTRQ
jgi:hypothetical protein